MAKCLYCDKEFPSKRLDAKYCSELCRQNWHRKVSAMSISNQKFETDKSVTDKSVTDKSETDKEGKSVYEQGIEIPVEIQKLTRRELKLRIDSYPGNKWKDSLEYAELLRRLKTKSVAELTAEEYWIPNWKLHGLPCAVKLER